METQRAGAPAGTRRRPDRSTPSADAGRQAFTLDRPDLDARFAAVADRRLIAVVAGAGYGKSTTIDGWLAGRQAARYAVPPTPTSFAELVSSLVGALAAVVPGLATDSAAALALAGGGGEAERPSDVEAIAGFLAGLLGQRVTFDLYVAIDDVHDLDPDGPGARLIGTLVRQAPVGVHLVLGSRQPLPFPTERLRVNGEVGAFGAADLAFSAAEIAELLAAAGLGEPGGLADELYQATSGWPAAVRLATEALAGRRPEDWRGALDDLRRPGGPLFGYLARDVFEREPESTRQLIRALSVVGPVTPGLAAHLGIGDAPNLLEALVARGLFVQRQGAGYVLHDLVRGFTLSSWPVTVDERADLLRQAAAWHRSEGNDDDAMRALAEAADWPALADLIVERGPVMVRTGGARSVAELGERLPVPNRRPDVSQVVAESLATLGRTDEALTWLELATTPGERMTPAVASRKAMSLYLRDELEQVMDVYREADPGRGTPADMASLLAWAAAASRRLGHPEQTQRLAEEALAAAELARDDRATAAAHTAAGLAAEARGDQLTSQDHAARALAAAERAGDLLQVVRIRINRASDRLESAAYQAAIRELDLALELAELTGLKSLSALALMNRGLANWCLGRLEDARTDYEASVDAYRAIGSRELAYALIGRGDVHRERGDLELARSAYEEGLALAERSGDRQGLVPGLYQLAKVLVTEDPARAVQLADRAVAYGWPDRPWALNARGWIAWLGDDRSTAIECADAAAATARETGDQFGLAEALELRAMAHDDPVAATSLLERAASIWTAVGNGLREATVRLAIARLATGPRARATADAAAARLASMGISSSPAGAAGLLTALARQGPEQIEIRSLGGFRVLRDGHPVAIEEWHSKKARDLLKILVARRGRPITREALMEALWPDEEPEVLSNRLSVAVSMLRSLLDPGKRFDAERFVKTDKTAVALDLDTVAVDVEAFMAHAATGFDLRRRRQTAEARDRLSTAEAAYTGDFLEENPYDDWAVSLREEARAQYLSVARALARDAESTGDTGAEVRYWLRLLERDPYDEDAHLSLVRVHLRTGALGEARTAYSRYAARMEDLNVEAAPFPDRAPLKPRPDRAR